MLRFRAIFPLMIVAGCLFPLLAEDKPVPEMTLHELTGRPYRIPDPEAKATVVYCAALECPNAIRYWPRMADLVQDYHARGVRFLAVFSNAQEDPAEIRRQARLNAWPMPALLDQDQKLANALGVKYTPTVVLLDPGQRVRYRGAVDDHKTESLVRKKHLRDALEAFLAGKDIAVRETPVTGCSIQRKMKEEGRDGQVTYSGQVANILHNHCASCHRPGQVAPFSLLTYDQARRWAADIKAYTQSRTMPPWKPVNHGMFRGERVLTPEQIKLLARWVDDGAPLGDAGQVPSPPQFQDGWQLGQPALILEAEEYEIEAVGNDEYRCFVLDPKLERTVYVKATEFKPGNPRVVHHVMTYIDVTEASRLKDEADPRPGYSSRGTGPGFVPIGDLSGWGPGMQPFALDDGLARILPKGAKIVMEVHYHKNGRPEKDRTKLGLFLAREPVKKLVRSQVVLDMSFVIPAGARRHEVRATWDVKEDLHAIALAPHMHMIGKEIRVDAAFPDGVEKTLVRIADWDFDWQEIYYFKEPFSLPKGTQVRLTGWFDNSADNPNNPCNPPVTVRFGEATTDEMCVAYILYSRDRE